MGFFADNFHKRFFSFKKSPEQIPAVGHGSAENMIEDGDNDGSMPTHDVPDPIAKGFKINVQQHQTTDAKDPQIFDPEAASLKKRIEAEKAAKKAEAEAYINAPARSGGEVLDEATAIAAEAKIRSEIAARNKNTVTEKADDKDLIHKTAETGVDAADEEIIDLEDLEEEAGLENGTAENKTENDPSGIENQVPDYTPTQGEQPEPEMVSNQELDPLGIGAMVPDMVPGQRREPMNEVQSQEARTGNIDADGTMDIPPGPTQSEAVDEQESNGLLDEINDNAEISSAMAQAAEQEQLTPEQELEQKRLNMEQSFNHLLEAQTAALDANKDLDTFSKIALRLGIRRNQGQAFEHAQQMKSQLEVAQKNYHQNLHEYTQQFISQQHEKLSAEGIRSKKERNAKIQEFVFKEPCVTITENIEGQERKIETTIYNLFISHQRRLNQAKIDQLNGFDRSLMQKAGLRVKDYLAFAKDAAIAFKEARMSKKELEKKDLKAVQSETAKREKIAQMLRKGKPMEKILGSVEKDVKRKEKVTLYFKHVLQPGQRIFDVLMNAFNHNKNEFAKAWAEFRQTALSNLKEKYRMNDAEAAQYYFFRLKNLQPGETIFIIKSGVRKRIEFLDFDRFYGTEKYAKYRKQEANKAVQPDDEVLQEAA